MTCEACHSAKVKCSHNHNSTQPSSLSSSLSDRKRNFGIEKCARCHRLGVSCVPWVSRQGQGKKRRRASPTKQVEVLLTEKQFIKSKKVGTSAHDSSFFNPTSTSTLPARSAHPEPHLGLHHLLRLWVGFSFRRRSFGLLEIATRLANKCGVSMDQVFCGDGLPLEWRPQSCTDVDPQHSRNENWRQLDFLEKIITSPVKNQEPDMIVKSLDLMEIPNEILSMTSPSSQDGKSLPCLLYTSPSPRD